MFTLSLEKDGKNPKSVLFLGAHCDDIEIGCGGAVLELIKRYPDIAVHWVVFSSNPVREKEARRCAELFLSGVKNKNIIIKNFRNGYFPYIGAEIKDYFEEIKGSVMPDIVFTHYRDDLHQDHRTISQLTWNTFRDHLILEYEIAKYDGDLGSPNLFIRLAEECVDKKIQYLMNCFETQHEKQWFTDDTFKALMRLRGIEANSNTSYAEAYYCRKLVF